MLSRRHTRLLFPVLLLSATAGATQAHVPTHAITFRDIEFDYPKNERLAVARTRFGAELPVGTPIPQAEVVLRKADARCSHYVPGDGLSCRFDMTDAPYNHLHDIEWTVRVAEAAGRLTFIAIDRQSYGSWRTAFDRTGLLSDAVAVAATNSRATSEDISDHSSNCIGLTSSIRYDFSSVDRSLSPTGEPRPVQASHPFVAE